VQELRAAKQYATAIGSQAWMLVENGKLVDSYGPLDAKVFTLLQMIIAAKKR